MISLKRSSLLLFGLLLTVFIAACSNPLSGNTTTGEYNTTRTTNRTTTKQHIGKGYSFSRYGKTSNMPSTTQWLTLPQPLKRTITWVHK